MPKGVKRPEQVLVIRGRRSWKQDRPLWFETTAGYLWVGYDRPGEDPEYLFSMSSADQRKLGEFLLAGADKEGRDVNG